MPHVDEGTLHALLDGELAAAEAAEVRVHFATCPSCAARLDEARQLLAETERLVSALELPGGVARAEAGERAGGRPAIPRPAAAAGSAVADAPRPLSPGAPLPPLDPVVLIPENPTIRELRRSRLRVMGWAAGFLVIVGAGFFGVTRFREMPRDTDGRLRLSPDEFTTAPPRSEREGASADSGPTLALSDSHAPALAPEAPTPAAKSRAEAGKAPAPVAEPKAAPTPTTPKAEPANAAAAKTERAKTRAAPASTPAPARGTAADQPANDREEPQLAKTTSALRDNAAPAAARRDQAESPTASEATVELDRRRTRERAAEATAALDRQMAQRRQVEERERQLATERAVAASASAPPAPPAVDERTGLSSRIGLDEAARQLGGPLHAIDGLSRQSVGLVPGASVEGADPDRPVVRAVYTDRSSGTILFLDQQMARPGDGPATPQTGAGGRQVWVKDGVLLVLHGDVGADSLRSLARRVR